MKNKKIYLIGGGIVALAVVMILLCVFVPIWAHRAEMKEIFGKLGDPARVTVGDPDYRMGSGILDNRGKEVLLEGDYCAEILALLNGIAVSGYDADGTEKMPAGSLELNLKVKTAGGEIVNLWFNEEHFYYMNGTVAVLFKAKDADSYRVLVAKLEAALAALES